MTCNIDDLMIFGFHRVLGLNCKSFAARFYCRTQCFTFQVSMCGTTEFKIKIINKNLGQDVQFSYEKNEYDTKHFIYI